MLAKKLIQKENINKKQKTKNIVLFKKKELRILENSKISKKDMNNIKLIKKLFNGEIVWKSHLD